MRRFALSAVALAAALLFGASTPFAKQMVGDVSPIIGMAEPASTVLY